MSYSEDLRKRLAGNGKLAKPKKGGLGETHPTLWEILTLSKYGDGTPRKPGSFSFWWDPLGYFSVCITDRDLGLQWFAEALDLESLFDAAESRLRDMEHPPRETAEGKKLRAQLAKRQEKLDSSK